MAARRPPRKATPRDPVEAYAKAVVGNEIVTGRLVRSTIEAGIGLKALIDEREPGAEIYSAATTKDQARIVFSEAERMRAGSPALRRRITRTTNNLAVVSTASWFRPHELAWRKANPSLGSVLKIEDLRAEIALAREMPSRQNAIRRPRLNQWTQQVVRWIDMEVWAAAAEAIDADALRGRRCFGGLDLARVNDLSSQALLFPPVEAGERWKVLWRHWCPEDNIEERSRRDRAPYTVWRDQGHLIATEGNTTDFKFVEAAILELAGIYNIEELAFDRTFAGEIVRNLGDEGMNLVEFGQGFLSMGPATAEFTRKLLARELQHGSDPVSDWCASNVTVRTDPAGNQKPDKERSIERIDPIVALIMAVGRSMVEQSGIYSDGRGLLILGR